MMLDLNKVDQIYLVCGKTDLRKGIDGLVGVVTEQFELDPYRRTLFLFCGTRKDRFKALLWEGDGFCSCIKDLKTVVYNGHLTKPLCVN